MESDHWRLSFCLDNIMRLILVPIGFLAFTHTTLGSGHGPAAPPVIPEVGRISPITPVRNPEETSSTDAEEVTHYQVVHMDQFKRCVQYR